MTTIAEVREWIEKEIADADWKERGATSRMGAAFFQGYAVALRRVISQLDELE